MRKAFVPAAMAGFLLLAGCTQGLAPPTQPTPQTIQDTLTQLSAITANPVTAWKAADYAVRAACHAYLNASASRSASIGLGSTAVGLAGAAGSMVNPLAGVASSLAQGFLTAFQSSGAIPWSPETAAIIENALDAYEAGVAAAPPATIEDAANDADELWFQCSPGGYAILVTKAISSANVTTTPIATPAAAFFSLATTPGRPKVLVNGH